MDGGNGPKRPRSESVDRSSRGTTPTTQPASAPPTPPRDPALEEQLNRLGLDEDFKASLRSMSPVSRTEVINDIVRSQGRSSMQRVMVSMGGDAFGRLGLDAEAREEEAEEEESESGGFVATAADLASREGQRDPHTFTPTFAIICEHLLRGIMSDSTPSTGALHRHGEELTFLNELSELIAQRSMGIPQDIDNMSYEQLLELQERIGFVSKGITPEQIRQCIREVQRPREGNCVVCLTEWTESDKGEKYVELKKCKHVFHQDCITRWLNSNKTCPVCTKEVI